MYRSLQTLFVNYKLLISPRNTPKELKGVRKKGAGLPANTTLTDAAEDVCRELHRHSLPRGPQRI